MKKNIKKKYSKASNKPNANPAPSLHQQSQKKHNKSQENSKRRVGDDVVIASVTLRLLALLYDFLLVVAVLLVISIALVAMGTFAFGVQGSTSTAAKELPAWYRYLILFPAMVASVVGFYGVFWKKSGQTLGMQTWRLQTVDAQGKLLSWRKSILRCTSACLLPFLGAWVAKLLFDNMSITASMFCLGFLANYAFIWTTSKRRAVHDMLSNTLTVRVPVRQAGIISDLKQKLIKSKVD